MEELKELKDEIEILNGLVELKQIRIERLEKELKLSNENNELLQNEKAFYCKLHNDISKELKELKEDN
jgi:hypothetical protein